MQKSRTIAMYTDHDPRNAAPIETSRVTLYYDPRLPPEEVEMAKQIQVERLHSMAKRMPYNYWLERG